MKAKILMMAAMLFVALAAAAQTDDAPKQHGRKKVGVVLSGGGAKGVAHVRALKVIEEAGIPVDFVVGTSMGSLVGGMYASGYNADQIDSIIQVQDWKTLLTDATSRKERNLADRQRMDNYLLKVRFEKSPFEVVEGGLLKGNNVARLITSVTADTPGPISYNDLKIPFACVATDIVSGREVDMHKGILAESMRASMAIPGVFAPVKKDGMVLVDGGLVNNYPVDVARQMGADVIIGVDVMDEGADPEKINSAQSVLGQILNNACANKHDENVANTDVYIRVNVKGYSSASFNKKAVDTLLQRGETAARAKWDELIALREEIGLNHPVPAPKPRPAVKNPDITPVASIYNERNKNSFVGLGARFDNEEVASLLLGGLYEFSRHNHFSAGAEIRLGRRSHAKLYTFIDMGKAWHAEASYSFKRNDLRVRATSESGLSSPVFNGHNVKLDISKQWHNIRMDVGAEWTHYAFDKDSALIKDGLLGQQSENSVSYFFRLSYDNRDAIANATRGMEWEAGYSYFTDNGAKFGGKSGLHIIDAHWSMTIPLSQTTFLTPKIAARLVPERNDFRTQFNYIGGVAQDGHYMPQQLSFAGVHYLMYMDNNLAIGGFTLRQHILKRLYAFAVANYAYTNTSFFKGTNSKHFGGAAIGVGYNTIAGPLEIEIDWSNVTKKVGAFVNIGFMF